MDQKPRPISPSKRHAAWIATSSGSDSAATTCTSSQRPTAPVQASQRTFLRSGYSQRKMKMVTASSPALCPMYPAGLSHGWNGLRTRSATGAT